MKLILFFLCLIFSTLTLAANPNDQKSQNCMKAEIKAQYSKIFSELSLEDVTTLVFDNNNFEYMILVRDTAARNFFDRVFVTVNNGEFSKAILQVDTLKERPLDLRKCF